MPRNTEPSRSQDDIMQTAQTAESETSSTAPPRIPSFIVIAGRGYTGKTFLTRYLSETATHRTIIGDGDRTNVGVSKYVSNARVPPSSDENDVREWLMSLVDEQISERVDVILDLGGADTILRDVAQKLDLVKFLSENQIRPVLLHTVGPDSADLAILARLEQDRAFAPSCTALLFNMTLSHAQKTDDELTNFLQNNATLKAAIERNVEIMRVPRLAPVDQIPSGITFDDAVQGRMAPGQAPLRPTTRQQIRIWLRAMEQDVRAHIAEWLP